VAPLGAGDVLRTLLEPLLGRDDSDAAPLFLLLELRPSLLALPGIAPLPEPRGDAFWLLPAPILSSFLPAAAAPALAADPPG